MTTSTVIAFRNGQTRRISGREIVSAKPNCFDPPTRRPHEIILELNNGDSVVIHAEAGPPLIGIANALLALARGSSGEVASP